jgi:hypothetical protein
LAVGGVGCIWGIGTFWWLDGLLQRLWNAHLHRLNGTSYDRMVLFSAALALLGAIGGAAVGIPVFGLVGGLGTALLGTAVLGFVGPLVLSADGEPGE